MARGHQILIAILLAGPAEASAPAERGLPQLWRELRVALDDAIAERAPRPPVPVAVNWRERRLASIDLGAPLLSVVAADLDRDGRAEVAALTTREIVVLSVRGKTLVEKGRAALGGELAAVRPRDPVGAMTVETAPGE